VHIFSIFGRLYHINSETDMHIQYFRYLAVCTTLIAKLLSTLLHLAGYLFNLFQKGKIVSEQFTGLSNNGSSVIIRESRQVVEHYQDGEGGYGSRCTEE
jgi:hypothetical protein